MGRVESRRHGTRRRTGATMDGSLDRVVDVVDERARLLTERDDAGGDGDGDGGRGGGGGRARGVRAAGSSTVTSAVLGSFRSDFRTRQEFFANISMGARTL